jgi:cation transport ATPase
MAIQEAVLGLIADTINIIISGIAKLIGKSESEIKINEKNIFWALFIVFIFILVFVTYKYG